MSFHKDTDRARRWLLLLSLAAIVTVLPGCFTTHHTVGAGPMTGEETSEHHWYALWGLAPMGDAESSELAGNNQDYRVTTEFKFMDVLISSVTSFAGFYRQTVTVEA